VNKKHRFKIGKMVRDKMPDKLRALGIAPSIRLLSREEYLEHLNKKLMEEAEEVITADSNEKKAEELGDLLEVMCAVATSIGITIEDVERLRREKAERRGGYTKGLFCECDELSEDNLYYSYYLTRQDQYPELEMPSEKE